MGLEVLENAWSSISQDGGLGTFTSQDNLEDMLRS